ncbi:hypothetical protein FACS189434_09360 [Bacteroidia bacterium]|nr:hypothetical protein FACS189434_09360 [Bacteroidia bacterium]
MKKQIKKAIKAAIIKIIKLIERIVAKLCKYDKQVSTAIAKNENLREKAQAVKKSLKKYDFRKGRLVWNSRKWSTYVIAKYGVLR